MARRAPPGSCSTRRRCSATTRSSPLPSPAALPDKEYPDDIELTFKQHVMSDLGIALDRIVKSLRRQHDKGNDEVPGAYLKEIIEARLKEPVDIAPPDDFKDKAGDFVRTRKLVDDSYCLVVRTGVDCDPMAYFWLGYGHALGKNVIPITELVIDKSESGRSRLLERTEEVGEWAEIGDRSRGKIIDLAFDIRAQRHMTFDPEHPELLEKQLERTLGEMIRADFAEWSRKKFWATLLGSRGEVSIITGGLHSEELNREMVGDWDLRAASELTSYFSRHQYRPKIETPIYQPELAREAINAQSEDDPDQVTMDDVAQVIDDIGIERKNCIVIASPDVNPLTEILLGRILGVEDRKLFPTQAKGSEGSPLVSRS